MVDYKQEPTPLGWDINGKMVQFPTEAVAVRVRRVTNKSGRPAVVVGEEGPLHIARDADMRALRMAHPHGPRFGRELRRLTRW